MAATDAPERTPPARRQCAATTKAGIPCTAWAAHGEPYCVGHGSRVQEYAEQASARSVEARQRRAAERRMTLQDKLAQQIEARADEIIAAALDAAAQGDWRAMAWCIERVEGKTAERVEIGVGSLDDLRQLTPEQLAERRAALVAQFPQLALVVGE